MNVVVDTMSPESKGSILTDKKKKRNHVVADKCQTQTEASVTRADLPDPSSPRDPHDPRDPAPAPQLTASGLLDARNSTEYNVLCTIDDYCDESVVICM